MFFKRLVMTIALAAALQVVAYTTYGVIYWEADWLKSIAKWTPIERGILVGVVAFLCWLATFTTFVIWPMKPKRKPRPKLTTKIEGNYTPPTAPKPDGDPPKPRRE